MSELGNRPSPSDSNGLLLLLLYAFVSVFGAMGSIFVVSAITVVTSLQNRGNAYLASLSLGHLIVNVIVLPSSCIAIMAAIPSQDVVLCQTQWLATLAALTIHSLSSLLIAADSCIGLTNHSRYTNHCSRLRVVLLILFVWMLAIFVVIVNYSNGWAQEVCSLFVQSASSNVTIGNVSLPNITKTTSTSVTSVSSSSSTPSSPSSSPSSSKSRSKTGIGASSNSNYLAASISTTTATPGGSLLASAANVDAGSLSLDSQVWMQSAACFLLVCLIFTVIFFVRAFLQMRQLKERNSLSFLVTDENLLRSHTVVYAFSVALSCPLVVSLVIPFGADVIRTAWWLAVANSSGFSFVYALTNRELGDTFAQLFTYCCCKSHVNWVRKTTAGPMAPRGSTVASQMLAPTLQTHTMINVRPHQPYGMAAVHGTTGTGGSNSGPFRHFRGTRFTSDL